MESIFDELDQSGKVRVFMTAQRISQADIAKVLDCTPETISNRMRTGRWVVADLKKIADHYGRPLTDLI